MSEPYKKVGRGGAGNFYSPKDIEDVSKAAESSDLEAQSLPQTETDTVIPSQPREAPEYLHTGRGGAGNWIQPSTLTSSGLTQTSTSPATSKTGNNQIRGPSKPMYRGGRGGAGNYVDPEAEEREAREKEEVERRRVEESVERDVERGLARPERAYGGRGGAWEMGSMG